MQEASPSRWPFARGRFIRIINCKRLGVVFIVVVVFVVFVFVVVVVVVVLLGQHGAVLIGNRWYCWLVLGRVA